eukprot:CAMPEP_0178416352 /NCGR_PEP_ID=MMETSP0689_2-20121128/24020_2 /TAXON_ID=160604 /ORGANISM="Amphidinium massartii, Strain CS-259" /LENGTH=108 /DNA_ID=CAMNT_0020037695 /DNA_START=111 /DNA_END=434 /DNA_ORIENTATION=-
MMRIWDSTKAGIEYSTCFSKNDGSLIALASVSRANPKRSLPSSRRIASRAQTWKSIRGTSQFCCAHNIFIRSSYALETSGLTHVAATVSLSPPPGSTHLLVPYAATAW